MTTLHFLSHAANAFLRWSVRPAVLALNGWARRAEVTCDRAGLICTRDLDASIGCLVKLALGSHKLYSDVNLEEYLAQLDEAQKGIGRLDELSRTHPYLPKRVAAPSFTGSRSLGCASGSRMSSTGTWIFTSSGLRCPASTTVHSRAGPTMTSLRTTA